jgi:3-hydroxyisobutyryl-CoA hydrolase
MAALEEELLSLEDGSEDKIDSAIKKFQNQVTLFLFFKCVHQRCLFLLQSPLDADKPFVLAPHMEEINRLFAAETLEGIVHDLQKEGSDWAKQQLQILSKMVTNFKFFIQFSIRRFIFQSPTSMKITLRQLHEGKTKSLQDVLQMEYRLSQHCMEDKDFYEGVRAGAFPSESHFLYFVLCGRRNLC